jgi:uncharacterized membrane protein YfcA
VEYAIILAAALAAGTLGGVVGTGSSMVLMPFLVIFFGPKHAVPIMAIASIMGNLGRVLAWRRLVDWGAVAAYSATAIPGAALGVRSLLALPARAVDVALGLFFISMIPVRRWLGRREWKITRLHLALVGAPIGFITGIVVSTGPISVPIFLAYGLEKGAFLSTEAAASLVIYCAKVVTFSASGALPWDVVAKGLLCGSAVMAGAFIGRHLVLRMSTEVFKHVLDALMLVSGLSLLWAATR